MTDDWEEMIDAGICPLCGGDCSAANPPVYHCPMQAQVTVVDTGDELHQILGEALRSALSSSDRGSNDLQKSTTD